MKHALLRVCVFSFFITLLPVGAAAKEGLQFTLGKEWKVANSLQTRDYTLLEFVREGDQLDGWKELVAIQNFKKSRDHRSPVATLDE